MEAGRLRRLSSQAERQCAAPLNRGERRVSDAFRDRVEKRAQDIKMQLALASELHH